MRSTTEPHDFVVVGGGTAGSVIAARLSQDDRVRVLLLEAGADRPTAAMTSPPAWPSLMESPANWGETTVPQTATGTSVLLPRARFLGGGSAINAMVFARGHRSSYDDWAALGALGWGFDDLLPYFMRSENTAGRDPALRGIGGPLTVGPANPPHPVVGSLLRAAEQAGHPRAADPGGGLEEGFGWSDLNIVDGRRQSAADAYLVPAAGRPNLTVVTCARVSRLLLENGRCTGVEYRTEAGTRTARARAEVVLTAGAIGSPQLLMLSGIGPRAHLGDRGIDVVADLPGVGANLHDHPIANIVYSAGRPVPAGVNNHGEAQGLVRSGPGLDGPDLQLVFVDAPGNLLDGMSPGQGWTIGVSAMRPRSRGTVRLASADPADPPLLDPGYFADDRDLVTLIRGLRLAREIGRSPAMSAWHGTEVLPGPAVEDDRGLREYVRRTAASYAHPVGTCRMGEGPGAVVRDDLRLRGIEGLRVADASVIPSIPSANTNATVCAIAERAAELLTA
ncbi:GMC family oxidoreductase [Streptomyces sp. NPDC088732]|uniref:GMC family oxidoreductase n=1 Tax=Streptomyces sp. NPDC088732 TaxID=3365879 RepID=UPI0037FA92DB